MTELSFLIEKLKEKIEEEKQRSIEKIEEEIGKDNDQITSELARRGYPGDTEKQVHIMEILGKEMKALEKVTETVDKLEADKIREKREEIGRERRKTDRKGSEKIMYGYSAAVQSLEEAEKLVKGEEYDSSGLGTSAATHFPDPYEFGEKKIEKDLEQELLKEFKDNHVHLFLRSSTLLGEATVGRHTREKSDRLDEVKGQKQELREELRKRAEDLDFLVTNASRQLEKTREFKEKL